jgi:uncharacterized RDD family membrane protein YckC
MAAGRELIRRAASIVVGAAAAASSAAEDPATPTASEVHDATAHACSMGAPTPGDPCRSRLGSRGAAQIVDGSVKGIALLIILRAPARSMTGMEVIVVISAASLVFLFGYELVFEAMWHGQTIGKRAFGLRVVSSDGSPARFSAIAVRNVLRIVDFLPGGHALGAILIFTTQRHQRLVTSLRHPRRLRAEGIDARRRSGAA